MPRHFLTLVASSLAIAVTAAAGTAMASAGGAADRATRNCTHVLWRTLRDGSQVCPRSHSLEADRELIHLAWASWGGSEARASGEYACDGSACEFGPQPVSVLLSHPIRCPGDIRIYSEEAIVFSKPGSRSAPWPQSEFIDASWRIPCKGTSGGAGG
jgi:hypothetical protein